MANISERKNKAGQVVSYRIRVSRGTGLKPFEMTWPPRGEKIPATWSKRTITAKVKEVAANFEHDCLAGLVSTERKTFAEYAEYAIELKAQEGCKTRTIEDYKNYMKRIKNVDYGIGYIKLDELRPEHLNRFYKALQAPGINERNKKSLSMTTINAYHRFISSVLTQAEQEGLIRYNVAKKVKAPRIDHKEPQSFQIEDIYKIQAALNSEPLKWQCLIQILIATGMRRGECLGLRWSCVDFDNKILHLCNNLQYTKERGLYDETLKTGGERFVNVPAYVIDLLKAWKKEQTLHRFQCGAFWFGDEYVFTQFYGEPMQPQSVTQWLSNFSKRHNLPHIHPHMFRHTAASVLIANGHDIVTVSKLLGHANPTTTANIYAHEIKEAQARAAETLGNVFFQKQA